MAWASLGTPGMEEAEGRLRYYAVGPSTHASSRRAETAHTGPPAALAARRSQESSTPLCIKQSTSARTTPLTPTGPWIAAIGAMS